MELWTPLIASHVIAAAYVLALGPVNILRRRRDRIHRIIGFTWVTAIAYTCISSFWILGDDRFTWLHGLSAFTIVTVTLGIISAVRGNIPAHRANMIGSYLGTLTAFIFAATAPGRRLPLLFSSDPGTAVFGAVLIGATVLAFWLALHSTGRRRRNAPAAVVQ